LIYLDIDCGLSRARVTNGTFGEADLANDAKAPDLSASGLIPGILTHEGPKWSALSIKPEPGYAAPPKANAAAHVYH
jgi:hypothetical protein